jgi:hypothetical protein
MRRLFLILAAGLLLAIPAVVAATAANAATPEIWFSPRSGADNAVPDYMELFRPEAPWVSAASHVTVLSVPESLVMQRPDNELQQMFADLARRHIKLGLAMSPLEGRPSAEAPQCGVGVEAFSAPGQALMLARKVKRLGGKVDYYTMDEPLYFGHFYTADAKQGPTGKHSGCHLPINDIAQDAAKRMRDVRSVFPDVKVGDVEPFTEFPDNEWANVLSQWFDAFQSATGERLAYFRLDLVWVKPWQRRMGQLTGLLRSKQVPLQVIYDGSGVAPSDEVWIGQAVERFQEFEGKNGILPQAAIIQSWHTRPSRTLPESDPGTLSNLVLRYVEWKKSQGQR